MKIIKVEFKNFSSYGNRIQTIDFNRDVSELYLVLGANGSGKSSLAKVITWLCYGKIDNANLKDLPNRINGNLWGRIEIESRGKSVVIERGISPSVFNVYLNGVLYDVAGKTNLQDFLDDEIFEIPYHVFKNVIILSVNDFKSFITMTPQDKKMIVDKIFGFTIINQIKETIKLKRKSVAESLRSLNAQIKSINESIDSVNIRLISLKETNNKKHAAEISELKTKLVEISEKKKAYEESNLKLIDKLNQILDISKIKNRKKSELEIEIRNLKNGLNLYSQNLCPTCKSPLDSDYHVEIKREKESELLKNSNELSKISDEIVKIDDSLSKVREKSSHLHSTIIGFDNEIKNIKNSLIQISSAKDSNADELQNVIDEFNSQKEDKESDRLSVESKDNYLSILENIMSDNGVKNLALKSIIPSFNNHILEMSNELGIPFIIRFDDKFNCEVQHLGSIINTKTLSTGERKKIDFVVIIAMIKMIKLRFPSLNILFLDEIFSSIDSNGVYHIITILRKTISNIGLNTFVINHTVMPTEYFDKSIEVTKQSGFSEFLINKID